MAAIANAVLFKKGSYAGYKGLGTYDANTIYITTDKGGIYLGDKRLGDFVTVANISALPAATSVDLNELYYAAQENVLARSNGSAWVQINAAGITEISYTGEGDIVTGVSVDTNANGTARILSVNRQNLANNATFKDVADRLTEAEGVISGLTGGTAGTSIAAQIETAVAPVREAAAAAQSTADSAVSKNTEQDDRLDDVEGGLGTAQSDITNLKTAVNTTLPNAIATAKSEVLGAENDGADKATVYGAKAAAAAAQSKADTNAGAIEDLDGRVAANEAAITKLNGNDQVEGSIDYKIAAEVAKILNDNDASDIDTLEEIAAWIKNDTAGVGALNQQVQDNKADIADHEGRIAANETAVSTTLPNAINKVKTDLTGDAGTYTDLGKVEDKLEELIATTGDHTTTLGTHTETLEDFEDRIAANETAVSTTLPNAIVIAKNEVLGVSGDGVDANTVFGAKAAAAEAKGIADAATTKNTEQDATLTDHGTRIASIEETLVWGTF